MSGNKKRIFISGAVALVLLVVVGSIIFNMNHTANNPERLISLGEKYLSELNYEQALVQFLKVIEIDPMNPRGYTGAAEAYIGLGRTDDAIAILLQGLELTGDDSIRDMLDSLVDLSEQTADIDITENTEANGETGVINLTGAEPFTAQDLEDWGFPVGVTIWDVQERFGFSTDEINNKMPIGQIYTNDGNIGFFIDETLKINRILMFGYSNVLSEGPRGIKIGMQFGDILNRFKITNPLAISFAEDYNLERITDNHILVYNIDYEEQYNIFMQFADIGCWWSGTDDSRTLGGATVEYAYQEYQNTQEVRLRLTFSIEGLLTDIWVEMIDNYSTESTHVPTETPESTPTPIATDEPNPMVTPSSDELPNVYGNTVGNVVNEGFAVISNGWIYYSKRDDDNYFYQLYKVRSDGTEKTKLSSDGGLNPESVSNINVVGDWIIYDAYFLYKVRTDGTEKTLIANDYCSFINVFGNAIYYRNDRDNGSIYRIYADGTGRTKLNDDNSYSVNVAGNWIYYCNASDNQKLYKISTDGTDKTKISDEWFSYFNVVDDWIYYIGANEIFHNDFSFYKIRTDGTEKTKISDEQSECFNVNGGWIYYRNINDGSKLYKIRTDGTERTKLTDDFIIRMNVVDDWVYYVNSSDNGYLYRVRTDGTERQIVE